MATQHEVVIIGGGNAGVSLAARLERYGVNDVAVVVAVVPNEVVVPVEGHQKPMVLRREASGNLRLAIPPQKATQS